MNTTIKMNADVNVVATAGGCHMYYGTTICGIYFFVCDVWDYGYLLTESPEPFMLKENFEEIIHLNGIVISEINGEDFDSIWEGIKMMDSSKTTVATNNAEINKLKAEIAKLKEELDIKTRAINTYQKSVIKNAMKVTEKKPFTPVIKVTPDQFADIYEEIVYNALDRDKKDYDINDLANDRMAITWRGIETSIELGAEVNDIFMVALKKTYKEQIGY